MIPDELINPLVPAQLSRLSVRRLVGRHYSTPLKIVGAQPSEEEVAKDLRWVFENLDDPQIQNVYALLNWRLRRAAVRAKERQSNHQARLQRDHLGLPRTENVFLRAAHLV